MKKINVRIMAEIAIFAALGFAIDLLQGGIFKGVFLNGGSIGFAMVPILVISLRRGLIPGILCGLIVSILQMLGGIYVINGSSLNGGFLSTMGPFIQVMLDYILAYTLVGFAGVFYKKYHENPKVLYIVLATILGGILKYIAHVLSGLLFWPGEIFNIGGYLYSFIYNGLYCIPNIIICIIIMIILSKYYSKILLLDIEDKIDIKEGE